MAEAFAADPSMGSTRYPIPVIADRRLEELGFGKQEGRRVTEMTEDASVSGFVDRDQTLANIDSNGYIIYYDYDNPINAWIGGQTLPLPGGGFLTPII